MQFPWPDAPEMVCLLEDNLYEIMVLILTRHPSALVQSQIARNHVETQYESLRATCNAYMKMFSDASELGLAIRVVPYESLTGDGALQLCRHLGLNDPIGMGPIENRNFKTINPGRDAETVNASV